MQFLHTVMLQKGQLKIQNCIFPESHVADFSLQKNFDSANAEDEPRK